MTESTPRFSDAENAFIEGLVRVIETSAVAYAAEQAAGQAMEANVADIDAVREERALELSDMERYLNEAVARSPFGEEDPIVVTLRDGMEFTRALVQALDEDALKQANSNLPVL